MSFLSNLKGIGINLFYYFAKGARVSAALQWNGRLRSPTGNAYPRSGALPIVENGIPIAFSADDIIREWRIVVKANLVLKNNSKYHAYNVQILNGTEIFTNYYEQLDKLTSLAPNESIIIKVEFVQVCYKPSGLEADELPAIPEEKENSILQIQYENESGTKLLTKFIVSFSGTHNEFTYP